MGRHRYLRRKGSVLYSPLLDRLRMARISGCNASSSRCISSSSFCLPPSSRSPGGGLMNTCRAGTHMHGRKLSTAGTSTWPPPIESSSSKRTNFIGASAAVSLPSPDIAVPETCPKWCTSVSHVPASTQ
eukprot:6343911-Pyramimonas_sp.AAC.1